MTDAVTDFNLINAYKTLHEKCGIEVEDKVKVLRPAGSYELGWQAGWKEEMDKFINHIGKVTSDIGNGGFEVYFEEFDKKWYLPFFILQAVEKAPKYDFHDPYTIKELYHSMWQWLEDNPDKEKTDWPGWKINGGDINEEYIPSQCFLCMYVNVYGGTCADCPGNWSIEYGGKGYTEPCMMSAYGAWLKAKGLSCNDVKEQRRFISHLAQMVKNVV